MAQGVVVRPGLQFAAQRKGSGFGGGPVNRIHHFDTVASCRQAQPCITGIGEVQPGFTGCLPAVNDQHIGREGRVIKTNGQIHGAATAREIRHRQGFRDKRTVCLCGCKTDGSGIVQVVEHRFHRCTTLNIPAGTAVEGDVSRVNRPVQHRVAGQADLRTGLRNDVAVDDGIVQRQRTLIQVYL